MKYMSALLVFAFVLVLVAPSPVKAQDDQNKAWMEYMTPGEAHKNMAMTAGQWKTQTKMWNGPGEPVISEGTATMEMILGGRYLQSKHTGTMMNMPFEGMLILGYDNATNEYNSIWIDNMGTGIAVSKGKLDEMGTVTFNGTMVDPMTKTEKPYKEVVKFTDENHYTSEMYMNQNGQEVKFLEIDFSR